MARKAPKNPINDIVDTVGAWFGGRGPGTNPQVSRVSRDLGRAVSAADTVTGGFGAAALRDVKKFQQGGSLPTNLAKTTAVNLVAGAVGAKAAQVAGPAIAKTAKKVANTNITERISNRLTREFTSMPVSKFQKKYKVSHPYSGNNWDDITTNDYFWEGPTMSRVGSIDGGDMERLTKDIAERGILRPVQVSGKNVLDGHHRVVAARDVGPKTKIPIQKVRKNSPKRK